MGVLGLKVEKRFNPPSTFIKILVPVLATLISFALFLILLSLGGVNLGDSFSSLLRTFGSKTGITEIFVRATSLLIVGLAITIAFRGKVFNIGAEGQMIMGAIIATWIGLTIPEAPAVLLVIFILVSSFLIGSLWGGIAGVLKAKLGINEVIVTIMMNWVAIYFLEYVIIGPLSVGGMLHQSPPLSSSAWLPVLIPGTRLHFGFLIALFLTYSVLILIFKTSLGYHIRTIGANPVAARYAGVSPAKIIVIVMVMSGGLASIAGATEVIGTHHILLPGISAGYGYFGIAVALLGRLHPIGVLTAAVGIGALIVAVQSMLGTLPILLQWVIIGSMILFLMVCDTLTQYRIRGT